MTKSNQEIDPAHSDADRDLEESGAQALIEARQLAALERTAETLASERIAAEQLATLEARRREQLEGEARLAVEARLAAERRLEEAAVERQQAEAAAAKFAEAREKDEAEISESIRRRAKADADSIEEAARRIAAEQRMRQIVAERTTLEVDAERLARERIDADLRALDAFHLRKNGEAKSHQDVEMDWSNAQMQSEWGGEERLAVMGDAGGHENAPAPGNGASGDSSREEPLPEPLRVAAMADSPNQAGGGEVDAEEGAGHAPVAERRNGFRQEWQVFRDGLELMGVGMTSLVCCVILLIGMSIGVLGLEAFRTPANMSKPEPESAAGTASISSGTPISPVQENPSPRLAEIPSGLRIDDDVDAFIGRVGRSSGKK